MYLKDRRPVVLNHNPFMMFNDDPNPEYMSQVCSSREEKNHIISVFERIAMLQWIAV